MTNLLRFSGHFLINFPPFYWLQSRMDRQSLIGYIYKDFGLYFLVGLLWSFQPWLDSLLWIGVSWIGMICIYEIGYWDNDRVAIFEKNDQVLRHIHSTVNPYVFIIIRSGLFIICTYFVIKKTGIFEYAYLLFLLLIVFFIHNYLKESNRIATFTILRFLKLSIPVAFILFHTDIKEACQLSYFFPICLLSISPNAAVYFFRKRHGVKLHDIEKNFDALFSVYFIFVCLLIAFVTRDWYMPLIAGYIIFGKAIILLLNIFKQNRNKII